MISYFDDGLANVFDSGHYFDGCHHLDDLLIWDLGCLLNKGFVGILLVDLILMGDILIMTEIYFVEDQSSFWWGSVIISMEFSFLLLALCRCYIGIWSFIVILGFAPYLDNGYSLLWLSFDFLLMMLGHYFSWLVITEKNGPDFNNDLL